ncbi:MAG: DUF5654 family protein [Actinomycetota bacterium]
MNENQPPPAQKVARKATHLSKTFLATLISLLTTAFGVVVALAWNETLSTFFKVVLDQPGAQVLALFIYAVTITIIGVSVIVALSKLAARLDAEPVEFKYPAPKDGGG